MCNVGSVKQIQYSRRFFHSNSKSQARPLLRRLFLCFPRVRINEIFQRLCFPVSGSACFLQQFSQSPLFVLKIWIRNSKLLFSQLKNRFQYFDSIIDSAIVFIDKGILSAELHYPHFSIEFDRNYGQK